MTRIERSWLPDGALGGAAADLLDTVVAAWSATWLKQGAFRQLEALAARQIIPEAAHEWFECGTDLAIGCARANLPVLAGLCLGDSGAMDEGAEADVPILESFARAAIEDLGLRVAAASGVAPTGTWSTDAPSIARPHAGILGVATDGLIHVVVAEERLIDRRKADLPAEREVSPLGTISAALGRQSVTIAAGLGRSVLTVGDMTSLAVGDVLLLEHKVDAPLQISLEGGNRFGKCAIERDSTQIQLRLLEAITR